MGLCCGEWVSQSTARPCTAWHAYELALASTPGNTSAALAGAKHVYKVQALGGPLAVTLVWTDFPALASGG